MPRWVSASRSPRGRLSGICPYFAEAGGKLRSAVKQRLTAPLACHCSTTARTPVGLVQGGFGLLSLDEDPVDLEALFLELTGGAAAAPSPEMA